MSAAPISTVALARTDERRIAPRRQPAMGTVCRLDSPNGGPTPLALVWNISRTGISMLLNTPQPASTALTGYLETVVGEAMQRVAMKVVHLRLLGTSDYFIGAHFDHPLTAEQMKPFVAEWSDMN